MNRTDGPRREDSSQQPIVAALVDYATSVGQPTDGDSTADQGPIRNGSPFAVDPLEHAASGELIYDVGPVRYTAMGAVAAAVMVLGFASIAAWWFPAGGTLIAALGCVLSIFGMYSAFRITSATLLALHLCLFVVSYARSLG